MSAASGAPVDVAGWLGHASVLQFASLALQPPSPGVIGEMRALVTALPEELVGRAETMLSMPVEEWERA